MQKIEVGHALGTAITVQFRYEAFEDFSHELDRSEVIRQVTELMEHVEGLLKNIEEAK